MGQKPLQLVPHDGASISVLIAIQPNLIPVWGQPAGCREAVAVAVALAPGHAIPEVPQEPELQLIPLHRIKPASQP